MSHPFEQAASSSTENGSRVVAATQAPAQAAVASEVDLTTLALAARDRVPHAVRAFLEAVAPSVRGVCRGVLGSDHVDLDDTVQECMIDILRALPRYRADGPVLHYAKQIALRAAIAARKSGRNREQRLRVFAAEASARGASEEAGELPSLRLVREVIDGLPLVQAEAILMRSILGFSIEEIASVTEVSINTAKSRLRVAKESLRCRLEREISPGKATHDR